MDILKEELNSTSTYMYVPAQLTKDKLLLRHIDTLTPREDAGGLSREYVLRIPSVS